MEKYIPEDDVSDLGGLALCRLIVTSSSESEESTSADSAK